MRPRSADKIAPDIAPPPPDTTDDKLKEIERLFAGEDSMYRSPVETKRREVIVTTTMGLISQVDTTRERFGFRATVTVTWQITKEDAVCYGAETLHLPMMTFPLALAAVPLTVIHPSPAHEDARL